MANPFSNIAQIMGNRGMQQAAPAPTDPKQQTMMQQLGITNPLLQQFGQQVGNLMGVDTRSAAQQTAAGMQGLDPSNPQSLLAVAQAIQGSDPEKAALLRGRAAEIAAAQRAKQQEMAAIQQEKQALEAKNVASKEGLMKFAEYKYGDSPEKLSVAEQNILSGNITSASDFNAFFDSKQKKNELSPEQVASLNSAAQFRYGDSPEALSVIESNIRSGNITKADDFDNYVPKQDKAQTFPMSPATEKQLIAYQDTANGALATSNRTNKLLERFYSIDPNQYSSGFEATVKTFFKDVGGLRDEISFLRTSATAEINNSIVSSLPKGAASDRDVNLFSRGFPAENAPIAEVIAYLESANRISKATLDTQILFENYLEGQIRSGREPTSLGFSKMKVMYGNSANRLREIMQSDNEEIKQKALSDFEAAYGLIPQEFR